MLPNYIYIQRAHNKLEDLKLHTNPSAKPGVTYQKVFSRHENAEGS